MNRTVRDPFATADGDFVVVPVSLLCDVVDWFARHDGKADDFGRLFFVAKAEDILDGIDPQIRTDLAIARGTPERPQQRRRWFR